MKILLIIPAYNEEKCIKSTCQSIINYNRKNKTNYDFVVINDGSSDNTSKICHECKYNVVDLVNNLGIGGAVQTGYKYAYENNYDIAVQFDADGQHDVSYVKDIIKPIYNNEANMVIGSRFIRKDKKNFNSTFLRRIGIRLISWKIKSLTGKKIYDTTSGFRAVDKNIIMIFSKNYPSEYPEPVSEVNVLKHKYKILEVPVVMHERLSGRSSIHSWKNVYYMLNVFLSMNIESRGR